MLHISAFDGFLSVRFRVPDVSTSHICLFLSISIPGVLAEAPEVFEKVKGVVDRVILDLGCVPGVLEKVSAGFDRVVVVLEHVPGAVLGVCPGVPEVPDEVQGLRDNVRLVLVIYIDDVSEGLKSFPGILEDIPEVPEEVLGVLE